ncbi:MAG TPA: prepilin-type N-terminal cleavage/methylation domain-containing protein [Pyrinomonadaceae bacterium]|nr:prepilin-type N-terminal cleavage/methylation domain-containing protein [Pyrinomonadaceae bacterium]
MQTSTLNSPHQSCSSSQSDCGFSLLEMVVAITLLTIGLLGVASAIGYAIVASNHGRSITNTKLLAVSMLEQMETLRDTNSLTFGQISNVGHVDDHGAVKVFAGFQPGFQQVSTNPGPDGIFGTADDLIDAGPDGNFGTVDDFVNPNFALVGVTRQVQITDLSAKLKKIQVSVDYSVAGGTKQLLVTGYLNDNSTSSYIP